MRAILVSFLTIFLIFSTHSFAQLNTEELSIEAQEMSKKYGITTSEAMTFLKFVNGFRSSENDDIYGIHSNMTVQQAELMISKNNSELISQDVLKTLKSLDKESYIFDAFRSGELYESNFDAFNKHIVKKNLNSLQKSPYKKNNFWETTTQMFANQSKFLDNFELSLKAQQTLIPQQFNIDLGFNLLLSDKAFENTNSESTERDFSDLDLRGIDISALYRRSTIHPSVDKRLGKDSISIHTEILASPLNLRDFMLDWFNTSLDSLTAEGNFCSDDINIDDFELARYKDFINPTDIKNLVLHFCNVTDILGNEKLGFNQLLDQLKSPLDKLNSITNRTIKNLASNADIPAGSVIDFFLNRESNLNIKIEDCASLFANPLTGCQRALVLDFKAGSFLTSLWAGNFKFKVALQEESILISTSGSARDWLTQFGIDETKKESARLMLLDTLRYIHTYPEEDAATVAKVAAIILDDFLDGAPK